MRGPGTVCDKCGLRAVAYELDRRGIVVRFCEDCYWGEAGAADATGPAEAQSPRSEPAETRRAG